MPPQPGFQQRRPFYTKPRNILMALVGLILLATIAGSFYTVSEQERVVVTTWSQYSSVSGPGLHFKMPYMQGVTSFPSTVQQSTLGDIKKLNTYTVDNQEIDATITLFWRIPADRMEYVFKNVGRSDEDVKARLLSMAQDRFKVEVGKINVEQFSQQRGKIRDNILVVLKDAATPLGVEVTDFQIPNADYQDTFRSAVAQAAAAKAGVETREQELRQAEMAAKTVAAQAKGTADAARESARGAADAVLLNAQAEAKSIELKGQATAQAIDLQAKALNANGVMLVELEKAKRWNGALPTQMFSGVTPLMSISPVGTSGK